MKKRAISSHMRFVYLGVRFGVYCKLPAHFTEPFICLTLRGRCPFLGWVGWEGSFPVGVWGPCTDTQRNDWGEAGLLNPTPIVASHAFTQTVCLQDNKGRNGANLESARKHVSWHFPSLVVLSRIPAVFAHVFANSEAWSEPTTGKGIKLFT